MFLCLKIKYLLICSCVPSVAIGKAESSVFKHYFVFHTQVKKAAPISSQMIVDVLIVSIYILYNI